MMRGVQLITGSLVASVCSVAIDEDGGGEEERGAGDTDEAARDELCVE